MYPILSSHQRISFVAPWDWSFLGADLDLPLFTGEARCLSRWPFAFNFSSNNNHIKFTFRNTNHFTDILVTSVPWGLKYFWASCRVSHLTALYASVSSKEYDAISNYDIQADDVMRSYDETGLRFARSPRRSNRRRQKTNNRYLEWVWSLQYSRKCCIAINQPTSSDSRVSVAMENIYYKTKHPVRLRVGFIHSSDALQTGRSVSCLHFVNILIYVIRPPLSSSCHFFLLLFNLSDIFLSLCSLFLKFSTEFSSNCQTGIITVSYAVFL